MKRQFNEGYRNGLKAAQRIISRMIKEEFDARGYVIDTIKQNLDEYMEYDSAYSVAESLNDEFAGDWSSGHLSKRDLRMLEAAVDEMLDDGELEPESLDQL